ncbi:Transcription initiation factor TFIID subunit 13 [Ptychographa xylographoides]|nr:Transcription initiation factor TFIID subunit 13 [Ptychographa xylographoides]
MTEPRARAARHKGQLNFEAERTSPSSFPFFPSPQFPTDPCRKIVKALLYAYGDTPTPLPETIRILDEIVTDFIIETCHCASRSASYSNRQKIKVDDFKFAIRGNEVMLGRVQELLGMDKELKEARKQFDMAEGKAGLEKGGRKGVGRGRRRKGKDGEEGAEEGDGSEAD